MAYSLVCPWGTRSKMSYMVSSYLPYGFSFFQMNFLEFAWRRHNRPVPRPLIPSRYLAFFSHDE